MAALVTGDSLGVNASHFIQSLIGSIWLVSAATFSESRAFADLVDSCDTVQVWSISHSSDFIPES